MKKGLQKLTESDIKIKAILDLKQITYDDIKSLTEDENDALMVVFTEKLKGLKGEARDEFLRQIDPITDVVTKNQIWENNHCNITWAISSIMQENGRMPSKSAIAEKTGLSRQTIYKHLAEYSTHPLYLEQVAQYRFMVPKVLAMVYSYAMNGDIRAAKLYFEVAGNLNAAPPNGTFVQNQNNFIQINGMVLNQEIVKRLSNEQLQEIENIFRAVLPSK